MQKSCSIWKNSRPARCGVGQGPRIGRANIAGGDDGSYGVKHGLGFLDELELMERTGLSPLAMINSATGTSSKRPAFKERFGQIRPGFLSRFILTRNSPLETIANLLKHRLVIFHDAVFESDEMFDPSGL